MFVGYGKCDRCKRKAGPSELVALSCRSFPLRDEPPRDQLGLCWGCFRKLRKWVEEPVETTIRKHTEELPVDGVVKSFVIAHGLDTHDLIVTLLDPVTYESRILPPMVQDSPNTLTLHYLEPPAADRRIRVIVRG